MRGIIEFEILNIGGMDFKQFENVSQVRKQFNGLCEKIIDALRKHFKKYNIEIAVTYKIKEL